jgi:hypothetical protein
MYWLKEENMKTFKLFFFLFLGLMLAGCAQTPINTPTPSPLPTDSATPTLTPTITPTYTPSASPTPTAFPTLPTDQAQIRLFELLANNGGCHLSCLLGITVGKTRFEEARAILQPLNSLSSFGSFGFQTSFENNLLDSIDLNYTEGDIETSVGISYLFASDGIVNHISFRGRQFKKLFRGAIRDGSQYFYGSKSFGEQFHPYMLSELLSKLGKPTSVVMQIRGHRNDGREITENNEFELILVYPEQGVFAHYTTEMKVVGTKSHACPANAAVELDIFPSDDPDNFVESLKKQTYWGVFAQKESIDVDNPSWKSVEHATNINLDQFYEIFREDADHCIDMPIEGWATPAPGFEW